MFAPPVAQPRATMTPVSSDDLAPYRPGPDVQRSHAGIVAQTRMLQRSIGNQATLRLLAQRRSAQDVSHRHIASPTTTPQSISRQLDPQKVYCALHAAVCLGLSENPPAAALCWANFAARCGAGMASADQGPPTQGTPGQGPDDQGASAAA
jgi:hypothetical protein